MTATEGPASGLAPRIPVCLPDPTLPPPSAAGDNVGMQGKTSLMNGPVRGPECRDFSKVVDEDGNPKFKAVNPADVMAEMYG